VHLLADGSSSLLGDDLLVWLVFAMGGALLVGNLAALIRPPQRPAKGDTTLEKAPVGRSMVMAGIGLVLTIWALLTLLA